MNLEELIKMDLGDYDQDNPYPKSLTIPGDNWRHYELNSCFGLIVFNNNGWIGLAELEEDDCFWYVPKHPMYLSIGWIDSVYDVVTRMQDWVKEHLFIGWNEDDKYVEEIIKPIEYEEFSY